MDAVDIDSENKDDPKKLPESELSSLSEASSGVEWVPPKCLVCAYSEDFKFTFTNFCSSYNQCNKTKTYKI